MIASEFRIENLVSNENNEVVEMIAARIMLFDDGKINLKPIPLTEEWLLKFGFEANKPYLRGKWMELFYNKNRDDRYFLFKVGATHIEMCSNGLTTAQAPMEYVHQLQNLYFALTGKELKET